MKAIEFTNEEIEEVRAYANINNFTLSKEIRDRFNIASKAPDGSTISVNDNMLMVTPAKAFDRLSERTNAAREENEKRVARQMISDLEKRCDILLKENEALNLQITNN